MRNDRRQHIQRSFSKWGSRLRAWSAGGLSLALAGLLVPGRASAGSNNMASTTTVGVIVLTVGCSVISLTKGGSSKKMFANAKAAELYLRQNQTQLAEDLTVGQGPLLAELGEALAVPNGDFAAFRSSLRRDRAELLALADAQRLSPDRAQQFFLRVVALRDTVLGAAMTPGPSSARG